MLEYSDSSALAAFRAGGRFALVFRGAALLAVAFWAGARLALVFRAAALLAAAFRAGARLEAVVPTFTNRCASWFDAPTSSSVILNAESMIC